MSDRDRSLYILARSYAAGTLSADATADFEARLADEQVARDALVTVIGHLDPTASPAVQYRRAVHNRLHPPLWRRMLRPRPYAGHPSLWALAGAAAVLALVLCWPENLTRSPDSSAGAVPTRVAQPQQDTGVANVQPAEPAPRTTARIERTIDTHVVRGARPTPSLVPPMENP